jgi:predicted GTPase
MAANKTPTDVLSMILVMGVTGAGKSYFINQLAGREAVKEGDSLDPCKSPSIKCCVSRYS